MGTELKKMSWEIDNFSARNDAISLDPFSSGGCEWYVQVFAKGNCVSDHLSLVLYVGNPNSLRLGWKRRANFCFVLLNQSGKVLFRSPGEYRTFCAEASGWSVLTTLSLTKLQEKGFLEKNKLTIQVYIKVVEVVHQGKSTANDMLDFNGFQIIASQAVSAGEIVAQHPDFAVHVIPENQGVKTTYMSLLLGLIETLRKSPQRFSVTELSNAQSEMIELTDAGFKLDWLKSKLEEVSLERKKALSDGSWVQQLEERVKDVELALSDLKVELDKEKIKSAAPAKVSSFEFINFVIKRFFLSCFSISKHSQNTE